MRLIGNQCHGCPKRHVGCHADCESYKKARAEHDVAEEKRREFNAYAQYAAEKKKRSAK